MPDYLDGKSFTKLFRHPREHDAEIKAGLHLIAHNVARKYRCRPEDREDAAQEAAVMAFKKIGHFDPIRFPASSAFNYFTTVIKHAIGAHLKRVVKNQLVSLTPFEEICMSALKSATPPPASHSQSPSLLPDRRDELALVASSNAGVGEDGQPALWLNCVRLVGGVRAHVRIVFNWERAAQVISKAGAQDLAGLLNRPVVLTIDAEQARFKTWF